MKTTEKNYAINRINGMVRERESAICQKFKTKLTSREKIELIQGGKVKPRKVIHNPRFVVPSVDDVFDFSPHTKKYRAEGVKQERALAKLNKSAQRVRDEIMLGDEQRALELLREFEASA